MGEEGRLKKIMFKITNNPWINNGIFTLLKEAEQKESIVIIKKENLIELSSQDILNDISSVMHNLAAKGTYNMSGKLKSLNLRVNGDIEYGKESSYPKYPEENKKIVEITDEDVKYLKMIKANDTKKKQQIWKQRLHYLSDYSNYLKYGLNLINQEELKKIKSASNKHKYHCCFCNSWLTNSITIKSGFNPLVGEHHNNFVEGFDQSLSGRKNHVCCPQCFVASVFALFNYKIPFFQIGKSGNYKTYIALPVTTDSLILEKVTNNLGKKGQFIDFNDQHVVHYSTNIKNNIPSSKFGSIISLLSNIVNEYHQDEIEAKDIWDFETITEEEFTEIIEWIIIEKGGKSYHVKANSRVYNLLNPQKDKDGTQYLLVESLSGLPIGKASEYEVEKFYEGFLKLEISKVSNSLFVFAKESIKNPPKYLGGFWNLKKIYFDKLAQEEVMLNDNQKVAIKKIAESVARSFSTEVGILTKFAYSTESKDFKNALEESLFKSAKVSALEGDSQYYDKESLSLLFDLLDDENTNFYDVKNYFICFMSANVIILNYKSKKQK